jgi:nitric oxide reductase NorQ protein
VELAGRVRRLRDRGLTEVPSSRLLVATARLIAGGIDSAQACRVALMAPLTDDPDLLAAIGDLITATF